MARRETAARRYADAAFEIGRSDGTLEEWERDLLTLRDALGNEQLRRLVQHPAIAFAEKEQVLREVARSVAREPLSLALLMVRRGRPGAIDAMVDRFRELVRKEMDSPTQRRLVEQFLGEFKPAKPAKSSRS